MNELELLKNLIAVPSINPHAAGVDESLTGEARIADFLTGLGREYGLEPQRIEPMPGRPSLIFEIGNRTAPMLAAVAHLDTVNVPAFANPFELHQQADGSWCGLGACDNKGSAASVFSALLQIRKKDPECHFAAVFTSGEECEMRGVQDILQAGFHPDSFIICEGTKLNVATMHKGSLRWKISVRGKAVHSSMVPAGENAIYRASKLILAVEQLCNEYTSSIRNRLLKYPTLTVGTVCGGTQPNSVPDSCEFVVDRRLLPGETKESAEKELFDAMNRTGIAFESEMFFYSPPYALPEKDRSFCDLMLSCAGKYRPESVETGLYCATEAGMVQAVAGIPCVVFGPGDVANAHSCKDCVFEKELQDAAFVIVDAALQYQQKQKGDIK